jgi:hypothetical protein
MCGFTRKSGEIVMRNIAKGGGVAVGEREYAKS